MRSSISIALTLGVIVMLASAAARAMDPERAVGQLHHASWKPNDGAPPNAWAMAQTRDGWLWFGTATGLYRFDGLRFERIEVASYDSGLSQAISALFPLETGELWIGRAFGGASVLKDGRFTHYDARQGFGSGKVIAFEQDADGALWAATTSGLLRFDGTRWTDMAGMWSFPDKQAASIARDGSGVLWVAGTREIFSLRRGSRAVRSERHRYRE